MQFSQQYSNIHVGYIQLHLTKYGVLIRACSYQLMRFNVILQAGEKYLH